MSKFKEREFTKWLGRKNWLSVVRNPTGCN